MVKLSIFDMVFYLKLLNYTETAASVTCDPMIAIRDCLKEVDL